MLDGAAQLRLYLLLYYAEALLRAFVALLRALLGVLISALKCFSS
jgi:hypothetical protein